MAWAYILRAVDREWFKRCRRAWDFGAQARQAYEPLAPAQPFDFHRALHDALALYYFPGMWEWNRAIVLPVALDGFIKSMREQRDHFAAQYPLTPEQEQVWDEQLEQGEQILSRYFEWAPTVDRFEPTRVEAEFDVSIPDPLEPIHDLGALDRGRVVPIRFRGRFDMLVVDADNAYWVLDHRIDENFAELDQLVMDEQGIASCWAWENFSLGTRIAGTIYNELRVKVPSESAARMDALSLPFESQVGMAFAQHRRLDAQLLRAPDPRIRQQGNPFFRRTQIPRSRATLAAMGEQLAREALDMTSPELKLYPNPSLENCARCGYRKPCLALFEGAAVESILESAYRKRTEQESEAGRLGSSTWSLNRGAAPPKIGEHETT